MKNKELAYPDFTDTEVAFRNKSDDELIDTKRLFQMMNSGGLVDIGTSLTNVALKLKLPFVVPILKKTIFKQFCGGVNLMDCQTIINHLYTHDTQTILDYGAEAKTSEEDLDLAAEELMSAVKFAASNESVPVAVSKLTGLVDNNLLIKKQNRHPLSPSETQSWERFIKRIDDACSVAKDLGVGVFLDAEESWLQDAMDDVARYLMSRYNKDKVTVYNTYQLYRHDKLEQLRSDFYTATSEGYMLGAKIVRGAYMEKENDRAEELGYDTPIQPNKEATDRDFNKAILFCLDHHDSIAFCNASHNLDSVKLMVDEIIKRGIPRDHDHLNFSQLQGMSDHITFNLAAAGFNTAKYIVYGPVRDVVPCLIRRADENTAVKGGMSRELSLIMQEVKRRGL